MAKPALWLAALGPAAWLGWGAYAAALGTDPVETIQRVTGKTVLVALMLTLSVTPFRQATGWNELIRLRRMIGLTAFWYAVLHFLSYIVFDQSLSWSDIVDDVAEHPWVLAGFASFLLLVPLAVTSTTGWIRRLGGKRWQQLHRLVYAAGIGGVLHYFWQVKADVREPLVWGAVLAGLLILRLPTVATALMHRARRPLNKNV